MKKISLLGSTGSIGVSALDVIGAHPELFRVEGLAAGENLDLLESQCRKFLPRLASLRSQTAALELRRRLADLPIEVCWGIEGITRIATCPSADTVVSAMVGVVGLVPTLAAVEAGKDIALANKEILVLAGEIFMNRVAQAGVKLVPIDSEHSAIFQCLQGVAKMEVDKLILTASGGPFREFSPAQLAKVSPEDALKHPVWRMGRKITIDSATLMNKGLEVIEARWLFGMEADRIKVLIHPQGVVHSMIQLADGTMLAQFGIADMRIPIAHSLAWPERLANKFAPLDLTLKSLSFAQPDMERFPCLAYAYEALRQGGTMPAVLNAANEVAVRSFLNHEIGFMDIPRIIRQTMDIHKTQTLTSINQVLEVDTWARQTAQSVISSRS